MFAHGWFALTNEPKTLIKEAHHRHDQIVFGYYHMETMPLHPEKQRRNTGGYCWFSNITAIHR